jgi:hypothetical protein
VRRMAPETTSELRAIDANPVGRFQALRALLDRLPEPGRPAVLNGLLDDRTYSVELRRWAAVFAAEYTDDRTPPLLRRLAGEAGEPRLAENALRSLAVIRSADAADEVENWLASPDPQRRLAGVAAVTPHLPRTAAVALLRGRVLGDADPDLRFVGALYLTYLGEADGEPVLREYFEGPPPRGRFGGESSRRATVCALAVLGDRRAQGELAQWLDSVATDDVEACLLLSRFAKFAGVVEAGLVDHVRAWLRSV